MFGQTGNIKDKFTSTDEKSVHIAASCLKTLCHLEIKNQPHVHMKNEKLY